MKTNTFEEKLFDLLVGYDVPVKNQLALKYAITDLVLNDVIGEDNNLEDIDKDSTMHSTDWERVSRNILRAEQRAIVTNEGDGKL